MNVEQHEEPPKKVAKIEQNPLKIIANVDTDAEKIRFELFEYNIKSIYSIILRILILSKIY